MTELAPFDLKDYLTTPEEVRSFVATLLEEDEDGFPEPDFIITVLRDVVRSEGYAKIARRSGISREGLYKSLGESGDPKFSTLCKITEALGFRLTLVPITPNKAA